MPFLLVPREYRRPTERSRMRDDDGLSRVERTSDFEVVDTDQLQARRPVSRVAHNHEIPGSIPGPATTRPGAAVAPPTRRGAGAPSREEVARAMVTYALLEANRSARKNAALLAMLPPPRPTLWQRLRAACARIAGLA